MYNIDHNCLIEHSKHVTLHHSENNTRYKPSFNLKNCGWLEMSISISVSDSSRFIH